MIRFALAVPFALGLSMSPVWAAGEAPPKPTQTSADCTGSQVYDTATRTCVDAKESGLTDAVRIEGARELAQFGRANDALVVLASLSAPETADALTVRGYATRKSGDFAGGVALYKAALAIDPHHWQALSYLGQGLAEQGQIKAAEAQLQVIRASGGRGTWAEVSLRRALHGDVRTY